MTDIKILGRHSPTLTEFYQEIPSDLNTQFRLYHYDTFLHLPCQVLYFSFDIFVFFFKEATTLKTPLLQNAIPVKYPS